jgi:hypothetical protein
MSSYNAIGGTIKNSLTMHTIIRGVLTVGEKNEYSVRTHMHL